MKFFVFSIALFIVLNGSSAQLQSQASLRIQREFSEYVFNVETQAVNSANTLRTAIQARLNQFFNQYVTLRDRIGSRLNSLGVEGKAIAAKINKDVSSLVESLKNDTSDASLQPKVNQVLASLQSAYLDPIEKDIEDVRSAVNKNPRLIQCWDNNKGQLVTQFNKVLQRAQIVINAGLSQLDNHIVSLGNHVSIAVMKIEYDVDSKCEDDTTCIKAYYNDKYQPIVSEFDSYGVVAKRSVENILGSIYDQVVARFESASRQYEIVKAKANECAAKLA